MNDVDRRTNDYSHRNQVINIFCAECSFYLNFIDETKTEKGIITGQGFSAVHLLNISVF